jgi:hypothetical protein
LYYLGLDLGQRQDHTAIAVAQRREVLRGYEGYQFHSVAVRHVERLALGTPYPAVVDRVREILGAREMAGSCSVTVDATGVGAPVVDLLKSARLGCEICPVTITGGDKAHQHATGWSVPKQDLMGGLQVLLEQGELRIARNLRGARMLMRELMDVQARERSGGGQSIGAEGRGRHDDLVVALALACWKAKRKRYMNGTCRLPNM